MKIALTLTVLVAMAATVVAAEDCTGKTPVILRWYRKLSHSSNPARDDKHQFELKVEGKYEDTIEYKKTSGTASNGWVESLRSHDQSWYIAHSDNPAEGLILFANNQQKKFFTHDKIKETSSKIEREYHTCLTWYS
ncbi:hypothetical protein BGZ97_005773 [Linnemannia gamsii]|uniref:Uncharacterized protein n=1 Tax=Linnemannia gamsii TaxID=64522 RepID=A0A9P6QQ27_9FUNG|nr:hypothetical protein BGZ97_005773 [Linnemannia gamsii]